MTKMLVAVVLTVSFFVMKRRRECSPELRSPALVLRESYNAEPEKLGAMVFEHADGELSPQEVTEIAKGFARAREKNGDWVERFVTGYESRLQN